MTVRTRPPRPIQAAGVSESAEHPGISATFIRLGHVVAQQSRAYIVLLGTTLFLVLFGLVMVLSSSLVQSRLEGGGLVGTATRQSLFALLGVPLMLLASRVPEKLWRACAWPAMIGSCVLQMIVVATPLGVAVGGNKNWLSLGAVSVQPSELIKLSLVLWLGLFVSKKQDVINTLWKGMVPILLVGGGALGLVMLGDDLGTAVIIAGMLFGALFLTGMRLRLLTPVVLGVAAVSLLFAFASPNRTKRLTAFFQDSCSQYDLNNCWQIQHGTFALAHGGLFGVGLGNSTAKWSWLPAADNDFIFAVVGEELGLLGALVIIGCFVLLAFSFTWSLRVARTPFARVLTAGIMFWVIFQACVNIAVVLGLLPVLGVPLPLVSAGGTALLTTLLGIGMVLSVTRAVPERSSPRGFAS
ncbi:MAG: putative lipid II flippase FtsW [Candidatus Lumbricidophila eiseniae]|uniref:Probable peptidoglycan glycosyltransferase FtsW n=1 Tax=Candidatus Lumbricidiphila eiseniae TaxID=1969409 RepID=A0A2A6FQC1_9MICO|nr:MAG: putative lipid II flippase FtsW [Candidatus Lumbricidophila eiseniae]